MHKDYHPEGLSSESFLSISARLRSRLRLIPPVLSSLISFSYYRLRNRPTRED